MTSLTAKTATGTKKVDYGYDSQGNQTEAGADTFTYNLDHTLASATVGGVSRPRTPYAEGLQLSAVSNTGNGPRSRAWATDADADADADASLPHVSIETTSTPTSSTSLGLLSGPAGSALALLTGGHADTYIPDWLGGVASVVASDGQSHAAYDYDPYGNPRSDGTAGTTTSTVDTPVRFAGMYQDTTLGTRYTTPTRVYDPGTGLFASPDPVLPARTNPAMSGYTYVGDQPTVLVDPTANGHSTSPNFPTNRPARNRRP